MFEGRELRVEGFYLDRDVRASEALLLERQIARKCLVRVDGGEGQEVRSAQIVVAVEGRNLRCGLKCLGFGV